MTKFTLEKYSEREKQNWKSSNIIINDDGDEIKLRDFIRDALLSSDNLERKMYFGKISKALAAEIKTRTGLDIENYNCALSNYEVRKIYKDHGDPQHEARRGLRALTEDDLVGLIEIIKNPDDIKLDATPYNGRPVIHFIKNSNGITTVVTYVSGRTHDLRVQTMYSRLSKK